MTNVHKNKLKWQKTRKQCYMLFYKQHQAEIWFEIIIIFNIKKQSKEKTNILNKGWLRQEHHCYKIHTLFIKSSPCIPLLYKISFLPVIFLLWSFKNHSPLPPPPPINKCMCVCVCVCVYVCVCVLEAQ